MRIKLKTIIFKFEYDFVCKRVEMQYFSIVIKYNDMNSQRKYTYAIKIYEYDCSRNMTL